MSARKKAAKVATKKPTGKRAAAKPAASKSRPAGKTPASKTKLASKRSTKSSVAKKAAAKKPVAKKAVTKKPVAKKASAKKASAKKLVAKKASAKTLVAKKAGAKQPARTPAVKKRSAFDPHAVLGASGAKVATLADALGLARPGESPAEIDASSAEFLPWLAAHASPELRAYDELLATTRLEDPGGGELSVSRAYAFSHAVAGVPDDGCWVARVRALFCAVSPILEEAEELHLATWWSTAHGESLVFYTHQDEDDIQAPRGSIASFLVGRGVGGDAGEDVDPAWIRAAKAMNEARHVLPAHLDPCVLQGRVAWILGLFLYVGDRKIFGDGLASAPTMSDWKRERELVRAWPHLQAYWLLHHHVFDNREELPAVLAIAERRYAPVRELADWAARVLGGGAVDAPVWHEPRVVGLRMTALELGLDVFGEAAKARLHAAERGAEPYLAQARAARARLEADPACAEALSLLAMFEDFAGDAAGLEATLAEQAPDQDLKMKFLMGARRGNATLLRSVMWALTGEVDARFRELFDAMVRASAGLDEAHPRNVLGALAGLGVAFGDFGAYMRLLRQVLGEPASLGRLRRLEIAVAAQRQFDSGAADDAALAFLRAEAARWAAQIDAWQTDTAATSLAFLLRRLDPEAIARFNEMLERATFSGANWTSLLALVELAGDDLVDPRLLPGLRAAARKGLGRHDEGDRALVWRALAACGESPEALEQLAAEAKNDGRLACERAAVVAGLLQARGAEYAAQARNALEPLVREGGSMAIGAAISMLKVAHAKGVAGFGAAVETLRTKASRDKHAKKVQVAWLGENAAALV